MKYSRRNIRAEYIGAAIIVVLVAVFVFIKIDRHYLKLEQDKVPAQFWGVTYSKQYAQGLGLDWQAAYLAMLDELQVKKVRIPVYWDDVAPQVDQFSWGDYDWMLEEASKRDVKVILAVGGRLPRWPECHTPGWLQSQSADQRQASELGYLRAAISHFQAAKNIVAWQIQNEYFVTWFGNCSAGDTKTLDQQLSLVRSIDQRPIVLTDSGEFSLWRNVSRRADIVGTTMYRVAWNPYLHYTYAPWPAWMYRFKAAINGIAPSHMIVAELQAEPWPPGAKDIRDLNRQEIDSSFSLEQFATNAELARRTGFESSYLWGVEWWYWRKLQGDNRYWTFAQTLFRP